jgi:hypothetical protein
MLYPSELQKLSSKRVSKIYEDVNRRFRYRPHYIVDSALLIVVKAHESFEQNRNKDYSAGFLIELF